MRNAKRFIASSLFVTSIFCSFGTACGEQTIDYGYATAEPDYSACVDTSIMTIGAHVTPRPAFTADEPDYCTQEQYDYIAECGINMITAHNDIHGIEKDGKSAVERALEYAENAGVRYIARYDGNISKALKNQNVDFIAKYLQYESFEGVFINDEPHCNEFAKLAELKPVWDQLLPDKNFYVNLYPMITSTTILGINENETYQEHYIRRYLDEVKPAFLSFDHYPLKEDGWGEPSIESSLLLNLEICAEEAKRANLPLWNHIQAYRFNIGYRAPNENEIRFQVMCSMAYGVKGYQYFSYWNHDPDVGLLPTESALMSRTGERTAAYYAAQTVNREVLAMDHVYLNYDWEGTMCVLGNGNEKNKHFSILNHPLTEHERIRSVKASQDTVIGAFKDANGNDAFMVVNYADPAYELEDDIEFSMKGVSQVVCYNKGVRTVISAKKGKFSLQLEPGNGVFIIPLQ